MMEIAYGPVVAACTLKGLAFGVAFAILFPLIEARLAPAARQSGLARRLGLGLAGGAMFGLVHLAVVCAADGAPPRIVQSTALGLALLAAAGIGLLRHTARTA